MIHSLLTLAAVVLSTASCSTAHRATHRLPPEHDAIAREILAAEADSELDGAAPALALRQSRHKIPIEINERVRDWIYYFTVKDRDRFHRFLRRGQAYRDVIHRVLKQNNVPRDLFYLAMIESGFSTHAKSHAQAVGIWQFIRSTGRQYGLKSNRFIDERRDPIRATEAASRYLADLHNRFDSWYLAMAGYNAGEYRILSAIKRGNTRDFWELADRGMLPRETMDYIPKFLAAVIIGRNPKKFGFDDISSDFIYPSNVERVNIATRYKIDDVARLSKVSAETLEKINPHVNYNGRMPASYGSYSIWMPRDAASRFKTTNVRSIARTSAARARHALALARYRVRRGDTLESISERFQIPISSLKKINRLKQNRIFSGQSLKVRYEG